MKRLWIALGLLAVLAVLTAVTIDDRRFKLGALAILAMWGIRTLVWHRKAEREREQQQDERE
jgi:hypothetical protein